MFIFFLLNAIFFGFLALIYTAKFLFGSIQKIEVVIWLGSFVWFSYAFSRLFV